MIRVSGSYFALCDMLPFRNCRICLCGQNIKQQKALTRYLCLLYCHLSSPRYLAKIRNYFTRTLLVKISQSTNFTSVCFEWWNASNCWNITVPWISLPSFIVMTMQCNVQQIPSLAVTEQVVLTFFSSDMQDKNPFMKELFPVLEKFI